MFICCRYGIIVIGNPKVLSRVRPSVAWTSVSTPNVSLLFSVFLATFMEPPVELLQGKQGCRGRSVDFSRGVELWFTHRIGWRCGGLFGSLSGLVSRMDFYQQKLVSYSFFLRMGAEVHD